MTETILKKNLTLLVFSQDNPRPYQPLLESFVDHIRTRERLMQKIPLEINRYQWDVTPTKTLSSFFTPKVNSFFTQPRRLHNRDIKINEDHKKKKQLNLSFHQENFFYQFLDNATKKITQDHVDFFRHHIASHKQKKLNYDFQQFLIDLRKDNHLLLHTKSFLAKLLVQRMALKSFTLKDRQIMLINPYKKQETRNNILKEVDNIVRDISAQDTSSWVSVTHQLAYILLKKTFDGINGLKA